MSVTIVVLNYNYARFVAEAVMSALAQTWADVEVVVVDNGSTDGSLEVIRPFGDAIRLVRQPVNIGQGQGYNLGFEAARGDWILWLDADDRLDPEAIATCMALVNPRTAKVQFALRHIDATGRALGSMTPFVRHAGDVVPLIQRFGHYAGPPGSGNLYRRDWIAPYFPVRPEDWPICTDGVPFLTAPFHGEVIDTGRALGSYRLHRSSRAMAPGYRGNYTDKVSAEVRLLTQARDRIFALLRERSGIVVEPPPLMLPVHVRNRITSWRWERASHPFPGDRALPLWRLMARAVLVCPGYRVSDRAALLAWASAMLFLPASVATALMASRGVSRARDLLERRARRADPRLS